MGQAKRPQAGRQIQVADIEMVFGRENLNKQLRNRSPKLLPRNFDRPG